MEHVVLLDVPNDKSITFSKVRELVYNRKVVILRGGKELMDEKEVCAFIGSCFDVHIDEQKVRRLGNCRDGLMCRTGLEWHSDGLGAITLLHCHRTPQSGGGDTLFASSMEMLQNVPRGILNICRSLVAVYGYTNTYSRSSTSTVDCQFGLRMNETGTKLLRPVQQHSLHDTRRNETFSIPLLHLDESTGKYFATVDIRHFLHFEGWEVDASQQLMDQFLRYCLQPQNVSPLNFHTLLAVDDKTTFNPSTVFQHQWQPGDVVLWHNNYFLHTPTATTAYESERDTRELVQAIFREK